MVKTYTGIKKLFFQIILILHLDQIKYAKKVSDSIRCLNVNHFDDPHDSKKVIGEPKLCHAVSKQCCFINITHYYGGYKLTQEYCNHLNVNITEFQNFLFNLYNDDEMFYANFTAYNLENYKIIGRNIKTKLYDTLDCYLGPNSSREYSTYNEKNCKEFEDGICLGAKNNTLMNEFLSSFHSNYSNGYCNKLDGARKCIRYNGARSNDKMILPLLEELRDYLQADNDEYIVVNNESNVDINPDEEDEDGVSSFLGNWSLPNKTIKQCKPRPEVKVEVICPEGYVKSEFLKIFLIYILLNFVIILL